MFCHSGYIANMQILFMRFMDSQFVMTLLNIIKYNKTTAYIVKKYPKPLNLSTKI